MLLVTELRNECNEWRTREVVTEKCVGNGVEQWMREISLKLLNVREVSEGDGLTVPKEPSSPTEKQHRDAQGRLRKKDEVAVLIDTKDTDDRPRSVHFGAFNQMYSSAQNLREEDVA